MLQKSGWFLKKGSVWTLILLVGPLALPFLWLSPDFKQGTKIFLTLLLSILTLLFVYGGFILVDLANQYDIPLT